MIERLVRAQAPGARLVSRENGSGLKRIVETAERVLGREFRVYVSESAHASSFALDTGTEQAVVFAADQLLRIAYSRDLFFGHLQYGNDAAGTAHELRAFQATLCRVASHYALAASDAELAVRLLAGAFESMNGLGSPGSLLREDSLEALPVDKPRLIFWHLAIFHEIGHLVSWKLPEHDAWLIDAKGQTLRRYLALLPAHRSVLARFEAVMEEGALSHAVLRSETIADRFAVDIVFRECRDIWPERDELLGIFVECVTWILSMNVADQVRHVVSSHLRPDRNDDIVLAVQAAAMDIRLLMLCQYVTILVAPSFCGTNAPTFDDHVKTMEKLLSVAGSVRSKYELHDRAVLGLSKIIGDTLALEAWLRSFLGRLGGLGKSQMLEKQLLAHVLGRFVRAADSMEGTCVDLIRAALMRVVDFR